MTVRVLIVDDSGFYRRRLVEIFNSDPMIEVVGTANNGFEAIQQVPRTKPDVVTMDIEMPVMDGITAVRKIMEKNPVPILMFSTLTKEGATATLDAMEAGAVDFIPKKFDDISNDRDAVTKLLCLRVKSLKRSAVTKTKPTLLQAKPSISGIKTPQSINKSPVKPVVTDRMGSTTGFPKKNSCKLVAIGTSTGGPVALQKILTALPANFPFPIIMIQHMPGTFTPAFSERLDKLCKISVKEAANNDELKPGLALLAPGGKQMMLQKLGTKTVVKIISGKADQTYKPCVDITFASASKLYPGSMLAVVLTGMGADGRDGSRIVKEAGSAVWAQDEASCVVYGMPASVVNAGYADRVIALESVSRDLQKV
ncbi:MAG: chemotaxis response regulator protein-glutamate methylesterase [Methylococcales bacterium]|jgi:two-component system chemotaxis response regulator CheB|nr:chemotaxis response regulator protein-glutamate methylesterase [Methylococcales bacterium]